MPDVSKQTPDYKQQEVLKKAKSLVQSEIHAFKIQNKINIKSLEEQLKLVLQEKENLQNEMKEMVETFVKEKKELEETIKNLLSKKSDIFRNGLIDLIQNDPKIREILVTTVLEELEKH